MLKVLIVLVSVTLFAGALSCGSGPDGPREVAECMFEAAQAGDYERMKSFMSPEMQGKINEGTLAVIEIISFSIDEVEFSEDSTEAELEFTITLKNIFTGETETEEDDLDMMRTSEGSG